MKGKMSKEMPKGMHQMMIDKDMPMMKGKMPKEMPKLSKLHKGK